MWDNLDAKVVTELLNGSDDFTVPRARMRERWEFEGNESKVTEEGTGE